MEKKEAEEARERLKLILEKEAFKRGEFILSSGKKSNYYFDGRVVTLSPEGAYLVGSLFLHYLKNERFDALGGPTIGADPIVGAVAALSFINKTPIPTFIIRKEAKSHGMKRQLEGPSLWPGARVVIVDDVATTGKAILEAKGVLDGLGVKIAKVMVVVDRLEGASSVLAKFGIRLDSLFTVKDFGF